MAVVVRTFSSSWSGSRQAKPGRPLPQLLHSCCTAAATAAGDKLRGQQRRWQRRAAAQHPAGRAADLAAAPAETMYSVQVHVVAVLLLTDHVQMYSAPETETMYSSYGDHSPYKFLKIAPLPSRYVTNA